MKQYYAQNPRPKREELEKISQKVGLAVRVVQVWFQNNRARDRREGRLVHVPYVSAASTYPTFSVNASSEFYSSPNSSPQLIDQPLDLSTKKSFTSSPIMSPYRYDSDDCGAVNLSCKSPSSGQQPSSGVSFLASTAERLQLQTQATTMSTILTSTTNNTSTTSGSSSISTTPTTTTTTPPPFEKNMLPRGGVTPSVNVAFFSMERRMYANSSTSPVTSSSPNYNGSCSPNSSHSHSWKQVRRSIGFMCFW